MADKTILLIEDEELVRSTTRRMLEASGYSVVEARDGEEGLPAYREGKIDVVLLDLSFPGAMLGSRCSSNIPCSRR